MSRSELDPPKVITTSGGQEILVSAVDYDWLSRFSWSVGSHGYAQRFLPRIDAAAACRLMHRELLGLQPRDGRIGDHINGNTLDNRRSNLRVVTASQSSSNVAARGISGYRGVYPNGGRWIARGKKNGEVHNLGTYDTPEEAAEVARAWRLAHLPGYVDRQGATA